RRPNSEHALGIGPKLRRSTSNSHENSTATPLLARRKLFSVASNRRRLYSPYSGTRGRPPEMNCVPASSGSTSESPQPVKPYHSWRPKSETVSLLAKERQIVGSLS